MYFLWKSPSSFVCKLLSCEVSKAVWSVSSYFPLQLDTQDRKQSLHLLKLCNWLIVHTLGTIPAVRMGLMLHLKIPERKLSKGTSSDLGTPNISDTPQPGLCCSADVIPGHQLLRNSAKGHCRQPQYSYVNSYKT